MAILPYLLPKATHAAYDCRIYLHNSQVEDEIRTDYIKIRTDDIIFLNTNVICQSTGLPELLGHVWTHAATHFFTKIHTTLQLQAHTGASGEYIDYLLPKYPTYRGSRVFIASIFHRGTHACSSPGGHHLATMMTLNALPLARRVLRMRRRD